MATEIELIGWALKNAAPLDLKIEHTTWISEFFPDLTDVAVHIHISDHKWDGWGWGRSEEIALAKAIAEAMERSVLQQYVFPTSNGLAAHLTPEKAANAARSELIERDLFLSHFLTKTPLQSFKNESDLGSVSKFRNWLSERGADLKFYNLSDLGTLCLIDGRRAGFGFSIGIAIKGSLSESVIASTIEAGRRVHRILTGRDKLNPMQIEEFLSLGRPSFTDHGRLSLNPAYANQIAFLFETDIEWTPSLLCEVDVEPLFLSNSELTPCPLHFARATSPAAQNLFLGAPKIELVNLKRLSEFTGRPMSWADINPLPHPLD